MAKQPADGAKSSGFGIALRRLREGRGLTQRQLAEQINIHPNSLAKLERGELEPSWPTVLAAARAFGVDCTAFGDGTGADAPEARGPGRPRKAVEPVAETEKKPTPKKPSRPKGK